MLYNININLQDLKGLVNQCKTCFSKVGTVNNASKITPAENKEHDFTYDLVDRVKTYSSPKVGDENNLTSYDYNLDGQSIATTTPDSKRIEYNYNDTTARLESVNFASEDETKTINYSYDTEKDQLTSINLDDSTLSYEVLDSGINQGIYPKLAKLQYDGGLLLSETSSTYNSKLEWVYDDDLRVEGIKLTTNDDISSTSMSNYTYNDDNQLTSAGDMNYIYDDNGFLSQSSLGSFNETYNYNEVSDSKVNLVRLLKPTKLHYGDITSVTNGKYDFSYTYDDNARIKIINNTEYFYDMQGRIEYVEVDGVETERYTYDANGNRLTADFDYIQSPINATYDVQDRMLTYADNTYTYTPNGSLLTKSNAEGTTEYNYDAMGNLLKVKLPNNRVITYQIDARGRRIGKKMDGAFQYGFIYGDQLNPIAKVDENGVILEQYVYGLKSNVPEYIIKNGVKYKIISDHLGSPLAVWQEGENTSPVLTRKYDSFGNIIEQNGSFELVFGFAGGNWDKDTKLVRFGVRDYDSETGRWTSKEPLGFEGSRNFYVYAGNNGVNFVDLDGLFHIPVGYTYVSAKNMTEDDKEARDLLQKLICPSIFYNQEFGGSFAFEDKTGKDIFIPQKSSTSRMTKYPDVNLNTHLVLFKLHTHGCWDSKYVKNGVDYNDIFSSDDKDDLRYNSTGLANYLANTRGEMLSLIYDKNSKKFIGKVFPDLDLSQCMCPNKFPYNEGELKERCGSLQ